MNWSIVRVITGRGGYPQNAGVLVVLVFFAFTLFWLGIRYELVNSVDLGFKTNCSIVWVITGRRGVSSERRHSSFCLVIFKFIAIWWYVYHVYRVLLYCAVICHNFTHDLDNSGVCFTNVSRALQDILLKFVYCINRSSYENFKLKLCTCAQSIALGTRTKFQFEILAINVISSIVYFREIILESSRNVSETTPRLELY